MNVPCNGVVICDMSMMDNTFISSNSPGHCFSVGGCESLVVYIPCLPLGFLHISIGFSFLFLGTVVAIVRSLWL